MLKKKKKRQEVSEKIETGGPYLQEKILQLLLV